MKTPAMYVETRDLAVLKARDLMTVPILTIPHDTPLQEAARMLYRSHISGAPVVNAEGVHLGIISSSDFVTWAREGGKPSQEKVTCFIAPWGEMIDVEESAQNEISHYMTARPIAVNPDTPVGEVAQRMVDNHIHRVLVVDENLGPCGIITSTDILMAVARSARRAARECQD